MKRLLIVMASCNASVACKINTAKILSEASSQQSPGRFNCDELDYGIYWYTKGNRAVKATSGDPVTVGSGDTAVTYYDPTKPTVIYVHGWQHGLTQKPAPDDNRETFIQGNRHDKIRDLKGMGNVQLPVADDPPADVIAAWVDPSLKEEARRNDPAWNVGLFYWNQFADEDQLHDAEVKIWNPNSARQMRWRKCDGSFSTDGPTKSASDLFFDSYVLAMSKYSGPNVRIVGHSLGNQMATRLAELVTTAFKSNDNRITPAMVPSRVALVDPYWSEGDKSLGYEWPGEKVRNAISWMKDPASFTVKGADGNDSVIAKPLVFELYKGTHILDFGFFDAGKKADPNNALLLMIGDLRWVFDYINLIEADPVKQEHLKHAEARFHYFQTMSVPPVKAKDRVVPSASASDQDLSALLTQPSRRELWIQLGKGTKTFSVKDDAFATEADAELQRVK